MRQMNASKHIAQYDGAGRGKAQWLKAASTYCTPEGSKPQRPYGSSVAKGLKPCWGEGGAKRLKAVSRGMRKPENPIARGVRASGCGIEYKYEYIYICVWECVLVLV